MGSDITLELFTFKEAAEFLQLEPETIKQAIDSGEMKVESEYLIPGSVLSKWWRARGGKAIFLEDMLEQIPLLPALYNLAIEVFGTRKKARDWLFEPILALGNVSPIEYAKTDPSEVISVLLRIEHGVYS